MKKLLLSSLCLAACALGFSQTVTPPATTIESVTTFAGGSLLKNPQVSEVVSQRIVMTHDIFGIKNTFLDVRGFGGLNFSAHNAPGAGIALVGYIPVAKVGATQTLLFDIGPVAEWTQQNRPTYGLYLGFTLK